MAKEKEAGKEPGKSNKMLYIIGIPLLVLLLAGAGIGAYFLGAGNSRDPSAASAGTGGAVGPRELGPLVELGSMVVNITHRESTRFLKMGITLEVQNARAGDDIRNRMPQIQDAILLLAGNRTFDDIKDLQGKLQLKADILVRVNELAGQDKVRDLFFTDFVVQ